MPKKIDESKLEQYAASVEGNPTNGNAGRRVVQAQTYDLPIMDEEPAREVAREEPTKTPTPEEMLRAQAPRKVSYEEAHEDAKQRVLADLHEKGRGYLPINVADLPTRGLFYPEGTQIFIRAATGGEIRHWSQTNETEIAEIDDALNYILDRCLSIRMPGKIADYKDIVEIDRFFLIFAIRDFTFPDGNNELMMKVNEKEQVPLKKDNIDFVDFDQALFDKFYDSDKRCFSIHTLNTKGGKTVTLRKPLNIYMPKVGVTKWLKDYGRRKKQARELFDMDFYTMAPVLIPDHRGLTDERYTDLMRECDYFGIYEYSLIEKFKREFTKSIEPKFRYKDKEGVEQTAPLMFQGGIKALFLWTEMDDII